MEAGRGQVGSLLILAREGVERGQCPALVRHMLEGTYEGKGTAPTSTVQAGITRITDVWGGPV